MAQKNYILEDINNVIYFSESDYRVKKKINQLHIGALIGMVSTVGISSYIEHFVSELPEGSSIISWFILFFIIYGYASIQLTKLANLLYIDKKNADQILKLHKLISKTEGIKGHKKKIIKDITNKSKCFGKREYERRKKRGEDINPPSEKECAKEMLNIFIKELDNYNIEPPKKKK